MNRSTSWTCIIGLRLSTTVHPAIKCFVCHRWWARHWLCDGCCWRTREPSRFCRVFILHQSTHGAGNCAPYDTLVCYWCHYISSFLLLIFPMKLRSFHCVFPSGRVNVNSINVFLCTQKFCSTKPTDSVFFVFVFSVYSMFYHDGVCLSCDSCNKRFTYLL